jgi:hypothetical protein
VWHVVSLRRSFPEFFSFLISLIISFIFVLTVPNFALNVAFEWLVSLRLCIQEDMGSAFVLGVFL